MNVLARLSIGASFAALFIKKGRRLSGLGEKQNVAAHPEAINCPGRSVAEYPSEKMTRLCLRHNPTRGTSIIYGALMNLSGCLHGAFPDQTDRGTAFTGNSRTRNPVAAWTALHTAGAIRGTAASPIPVGALVEGTI